MKKLTLKISRMQKLYENNKKRGDIAGVRATFAFYLQIAYPSILGCRRTPPHNNCYARTCQIFIRLHPSQTREYFSV